MNSIRTRVAGSLWGLLAVIATAATGCSAASDEPLGTDHEEVYSSKPRYFGYYASAMGGWDFTYATAYHANLTWIAYVDTNTAYARLGEANAANMWSVVDLQNLLFTCPGQLDMNGDGQPDDKKHRGCKPRKRADGSIATDDFARALDQWRPLAGRVAAFYLMDEPNNASKFKEGANTPDTDYTRGNWYSDLEATAAAVRATVQAKWGYQVPLAVILGGGGWDNTGVTRLRRLTNIFNWVGFDRYGCWENCDGRPYTAWMDSLKSKLDFSWQSLIVVPDAYTNATADRAQKYWDYVKGQKQVVAVVPFKWDDIAGRPNVRGVYERWGRSIKY